ncbi:MAG TPA: DcaP family trimeric outer membrane transporter [Chitinophagaceae bacterium]
MTQLKGMIRGKKCKRKFFIQLLITLLPVFSFAQTDKNSFEVYGFILTDGGYNFNSIDPNWFDVMRPTKLPKYKNEFGTSGNYFISVRQTRLGVRSSTATRFGELKTQFDFDLFGFGKDVGQTTIHLVNGFAQLGKFIAGQTPSTFMDTEVFPVTLDYWGPSSRIFFLNIQLRYTPVYTEKERFAIAFERPGATADGTDYSNSVDIQNVKPRLPLPNLVTHYRHNWKWGHTQVGAIAKYLEWKDISPTPSQDLSGSDIGWGFNASTVINAGKRLKFKLQGEYGEGFENYMADPSPDVALGSNPGNPLSPVKGKALPAWGFLSFVELEWTPKLKSSAGYSMINIKNADLQSPDAFRRGEYALINLRCYPADNAMFGIEYQYGKRHNFSDGFYSNGNKIQFSFKLNFSHKVEMK